jgi:EAL domain-containing protein (putative c-di-GMP-specific phosphodiesterase class I)
VAEIDPEKQEIRTKTMTLSQTLLDESDARTGTPGLAGLRVERNRFVALAFCNADLLFELDKSGEIIFAAGATAAFVDRSAAELVGCRLRDLIVEGSRTLFDRLLSSAASGRRIDNVHIQLTGKAGATLPLSLSGFQMSELGGQFYLSFRIPTVRTQRDEKNLSRVIGSDVLDRESFAAVASQTILDARDSGQDYKFTMFEMGDIAELRDRLDDAARTEMMETIGACFRAGSVNGDSAGQLDDDKFGLVHAVDFDPNALNREIADYTKGVDPSGKGLTVSNTTLEIDAQGMNDEETARTFLYAINRYCENESGDFELKSLSESFAELAQQTVQRREQFSTLIRNGAFAIAFQPICDLKTGAPHHFEALVRLDHAKFQVTPFEFITFAEEVGIICEFDLAMCQRVLDWVKLANSAGHRYMIAVNVSGRSLSTPAFVQSLMETLANAGEHRKNILFEITESAKLTDLAAADKIIQELRRAGNVVCLDDFGAGVSAFQYLSALHVDVVKIDGSYVIDAIASPRSRALLKAMSTMCRDLAVTTVAEMIEEESVASLVRDCGIDYGQGYHFGRPSTSIEAFESPRPAAFQRREKALDAARRKRLAS